MSPSGKGGPEEGTPEYDWLYGKSRPADDATRAVPRSGSRGQGRPAGSGSDEATRMMPVQPRPGQEPTSAPPRQRSTPPPTTPTTHPGTGGRGGRGGRRGPRVRRVVGLVLLLWIVYLVVVPFLAWNNVSQVKAFGQGDRPDEQPGTTYLLVGSDSRDDLTEAERKELGTGGPVGRRTDTIMLLHTGSGPNVLTSIPRDSLVDIPGHGRTKVNAAFAFGGPKLLVQTLEQNTGVRIDHYVEIGFGGFVDVVDAVGGIEICPKKAMKDPQANLDIKKGCQEADGKTALGYARSRKTYTALGDVDRARAQREVVSAVGAKAVSPWSVLNPVRYWKLSHAAAGSLITSKGTGVMDAGKFALAMTRVDGENGRTCGVPIANLAVTWDEERSQKFFGYLIRDETDQMPKSLCTPSGLPKSVTG